MLFILKGFKSEKKKNENHFGLKSEANGKNILFNIICNQYLLIYFDYLW